MKFSYKFSNLLGAVYRKGNLQFLPDGFKVISPVGNRVSVFDLKNSKSETLPLEGHLNFTTIAISPDGCLMILVNEEGEAKLCSLMSRSVIGTYHFHNKVNHICFSPDGKKFAVTRDTVVLVFFTPGKARVYNPFLLYRTFYGAFDETTCIDWSSDSKLIVVGSKDMNARVFAVEPCENFVVHSMGGHTDVVVGAFFEQNSMNVYSVSKRGHLGVWECNLNTSDLVPKKGAITEPEDAYTAEKEAEEKTASASQKEENDEENGVIRVRYKKIRRHVFKGARSSEDNVTPDLTACAYHKPTHIMVSGFSNGTFMIHEMPDFNMIHSLTIAEESIGQRAITSVAFNSLGDLVAMGCADLGQLLVWDWQSEQQALKQQSHFNKISCMAYSPNGQNIATGGEDGKVKVWDTNSGFSFVTFDQHTGGITGIKFMQNGKAVISCSEDGTVRAFDLGRYRNFKTFTAPRHVQFSCLAVDYDGQVVCAGCQDVFEIFVWSMKTNRLIEVFADHTGPVSSLAFNPSGSDSIILASGSWDKTVKLWEVFESRGAKETLELQSEVLALDFRPDGKELAVGTLNAQITFWDPVNARQMGSIDGRHDLGYGRPDDSKVTGKTLAAGKGFKTLCYSADGKLVLAGGDSQNLLIYSVRHQILLKKYPVSCNHSLDGIEEFLDKRQMTEWGNKALVDEGQGQDVKLTLPGVKESNFSSRHWKPKVMVMDVQFSPTGREWASATTEGLIIYSLDQRVVFDPYNLEVGITPSEVRSELKSGDYAGSLILALRLNEEKIIQEVLESTPVDYVESICKELPQQYVDRLLPQLAERVGDTAHLQFYVHWVKTLLVSHGTSLKSRAPSLLTHWATLQTNMARRHKDLAQVVDHNRYTLQYLISQGELSQRTGHGKRKRSASDDDSDDREPKLGRLMEIAEASDSDDDDDGMFLRQQMDVAGDDSEDGQSSGDNDDGDCDDDNDDSSGENDGEKEGGESEDNEDDGDDDGESSGDNEDGGDDDDGESSGDNEDGGDDDDGESSGDNEDGGDDDDGESSGDNEDGGDDDDDESSGDNEDGGDDDDESSGDNEDDDDDDESSGDSD